VDFLRWLAPTDGSPSTSLVAAGFVAGVVLEASPAKLLFRYFSTAVHELGHAFMAVRVVCTTEDNPHSPKFFWPCDF
jgi:hypothetical protein